MITHTAQPPGGSFMRHSILAVAVLLGGPFCAGRADEPPSEDKSFVVPPPRLVEPKLLPYYLPASMPRPGTREVWQYYGVDNRGRWLPRVTLSPLGAHYYSSGAP